MDHVRPLDLKAEEAGTDELVKAASTFLSSFSWANLSGTMWVGESIPGVLGLFLVEISPSKQDTDQFVWVVVGDIPPAYLSQEYALSPREALEAYLGEMEAWVEAVEKGEPIDDLIPVNAAPTVENAKALED